MTLRALAAAVLIALLAGPVWAQHSSMSWGLYGEESSFRPEFSSRELKIIVRVLQLRPDAEKALEELYGGYAGALQSEGVAVKDFVNAKIEQAEIMQDTGPLTAAQGKLSDWRKRSDQIKKTFLEDLKSLLTQEQESRWPVVERELRRLKLIGDGKLSGESVDLVRLTFDVTHDAEPAPELASLLNRYCEELDHALVARTSLIEEKGKDFAKLAKDDPKGAAQVWHDAQQARLAVRDINDRYVRLIGEKLSPEETAELNRLYFERSHGLLNRPTRVDEYLKDVEELKTLSEAQKRRLEEIKGKYKADRKALLEKAAKVWRDFELEARAASLAQALGEQPAQEHQQQYNGAWLPETHPLIQMRKQRLELDRGTRASLESLLTDEQRAQVPSRLSSTARFEDWMQTGL